jgi:hypothetical protein
MTPAQTRTIQRLTNRADRDARYTSDAKSSEYLDGPVLFEVREFTTGSVLLIAHNNTDERKWFMGSASAYVVIGVRGGVKVDAKDVTGFSLHTFTMKHIKAKLARQRRMVTA